MIAKTLTAMVAAVFLSLPCLAGETPNINEGLWEITSQMEMSGMSMTMPPTTFTQCLTKENMVPRSQQQVGEQECKVSDVDQKGDTVFWKIKCVGQNSMQGSGKVTYKGDRLNGSMEMTISVPGQGNMSMRNTYSGKRIGECQ